AFWLGTNNVIAYRVAYCLCIGDIPDDKDLDHVECDNPSCVNPFHVKPATPRENVLRSAISVSGQNSRKTACKRGHPLVPWSKSGKHADKPWRKCHICAMESQRRRRALRAHASQLLI